MGDATGPTRAAFLRRGTSYEVCLQSQAWDRGLRRAFCRSGRCPLTSYDSGVSSTIQPENACGNSRESAVSFRPTRGRRSRPGPARCEIRARSPRRQRLQRHGYEERLAKRKGSPPPLSTWRTPSTTPTGQDVPGHERDNDDRRRNSDDRDGGGGEEHRADHIPAFWGQNPQRLAAGRSDLSLLRLVAAQTCRSGSRKVRPSSVGVILI